VDRVGRIWEALVAGVAEGQLELPRFPVLPGRPAPLAGVLGAVADLAGDCLQVNVFLCRPLLLARCRLAGECPVVQRAVFLLDGEQLVVGECGLKPLVPACQHDLMAVLTIATCQFPVSADIAANLGFARRQLSLASQRGARVAHFPEGALSGYAGPDFETFAGFDWKLLRDAVGDIAGCCRRLVIWAVIGSSHRLSDGHKPHNSLYVINDSGAIVERYDKRFCSGDPGGQSGDLVHYSPGSHFSVWEIDGITCGALICYDYRYPELYREYRKRGVQPHRPDEFPDPAAARDDRRLRRSKA
jgi:hypothetical protein